MSITVHSKTNLRKTKVVLLMAFFLFACVGKSYATVRNWHFAPETDASKWEYEDGFGIAINQVTSNPNYITSASKVQAPYVEIKASSDGSVLNPATGSIIYRKIDMYNLEAGDYLVSFKFTAIRESNTSDGIYPQGCYFDICCINADGSSASHNYKAITNVGTTSTYDVDNNQYYSIRTGEFKMVVNRSSSQDIQIRVWPRSGVNFHQLLISDVEITQLWMPIFDTDIESWEVTSGSPGTLEYIEEKIPELPTTSTFSKTGFREPYIAIRTLNYTSTGYLPDGIISTTLTSLKPGTYDVSLDVTACRIVTAYWPRKGLRFFTGSSYDSSGANCKADISDLIAAGPSGTAGYTYSTYTYSSSANGGYITGKISLKAIVGTDGILKFSIQISSTDCHFLAFQNLTISAPEDGGFVTGIAPDDAPSPAPDDVPLLLVNPTTSYTFTHSHGSIYNLPATDRPDDFQGNEWKTSVADNRLANGVTLQWAHEYVHDIYVMPGEKCELEPFSDFHTAAHGNESWDNKYCDVYHRWYNYTKDIASSRLEFPSDLGDGNNSVVVFSDGAGNAKGHFGGLLIGTSKVRGATRAIYTAPLTTDSKGIFEIIAIDVACANGNAQTSNLDNLTEPTLAYRHIFVIHSAKLKADDNNDFTLLLDGDDTYAAETLDLVCPEGTPFQYRLDNFEYRGKGSDNQKPTGYYYKRQTTEGGQKVFKYYPIYHYRIEMAKLTGIVDGDEEWETVGSTTILGAYDADGNFIGSALDKDVSVEKSIDQKEEYLCDRMRDDLVYTYKCINGYDRALYWKKPVAGRYRVRVCAVDIKGSSGNYYAEDIKAQKNDGSYTEHAFAMMSYFITVLPKSDANMVPESELISNDFAYKYQRPENMVAEYGDPVDVVDFDKDEEKGKFLTDFMSNGTDNGYYKFPLAWEESAYGFGYTEKFDYDMYVVANSSLVDRVPYTRDVPGTTNNKMQIYDRLYAETNKAKKGNFLYVNAASDPGHMAKIRLGNDLCPNSRVYVSAWINEFNANSETANLVFTFRGTRKENKETEIISRYVTGYVPGGCNTKDGFVYSEPLGNGNIPTIGDDYRGQWMHVYYYFDPIWDAEYVYPLLESFEITIENNCTSSDGADYAIDDIRAFICKPNVQASQAKPICNGETYSHIELSTNFDLLLKALGATESTEPVITSSETVPDGEKVRYVIIDKEKYYEVLNSIYDSTGEYDNASALAASKVKGIYGGAADNPKYDYGTLEFSPCYNDHPEYGTTPTGYLARLPRRDDSSGRRMLYFPDYIKSDDSALKPNTTYWLIMGNSEDVTSSLNPLDDCTSVSEFKVIYGNVVKIDGQPTATKHGLNICSNQRPKITVDMTGVTADGELDNNHTFDHFDWFVGSKETFESVKDANGVGLQESLMAFRDVNPTGDETALASQDPTGENPANDFTADHKACLQHFIDIKKLSLYKTSEFPSTYDQFDEDPNGTSVSLTIIPVNPYPEEGLLLFCLVPFDIEIPISTREPHMKNGDDSGKIQYTMDDVPLRIGLTQLKKCCTLNSLTDTGYKYLNMPLRDVTPITDGVTSVVQKTDDDLVYLVATNDPAVKNNYSQFGARLVNTFTGTSNFEDLVLYIGKVSDITAKKWNRISGTNPGNVCHLAFFNNINFREGYWYTIRFNYEENYEDVTTEDTDVCPGEVLCTIKVVPEYQMWTGAENGNWNNDKNWRRVTKEELLNPTSISNDFITDGGTNDNASSFVPADFTKVIIPADPENLPVLYGLRESDNNTVVSFAGGNGESMYINNMVKTADEPITDYYAALIGEATETINMDMSSVDMGDSIACRAWYDHTCDQIHFDSGAEIISQQYLHYNKAWADFEIEPGRWHTVASPIAGVVAGDMYLPTDGARQNTPLFEDIEYNTELNDRFKPAVYQRKWNAANATIYELHKQTVDGVAGGKVTTSNASKGITLDWSHVYNDTKEDFGSGKGFSIKADVSALASAKQPEKVKFRLPKADVEYTYYNPGNEDGEYKTESVPTNFLVDGNRSYRLIEEDAIGSADGYTQVVGPNQGSDELGDQSENITPTKYFLVGNPLMCSIDMSKFFAANEGLATKYWVVTERGQRVAVMTDSIRGVPYDGFVGTIDGDAVIKPFQSFFVELQQPENLGETNTARSLSVKFDKSMMHLPEVSPSGDGTGGDPTNPEGGNAKTRAAANPAGILRISATDERGLNSELIVTDGAVRHTMGAETLFDSNLAEEPMIYSVIDGQAMTIGEMKEGQTIPVGLAGVSGETTIEIRGVDSFTSPLYLVDALMGETTLLTSDMTLTQSGNGVRYYLASKQTIKEEDAALSVPVIMTNRCHLTVKAPADASIENIQIFSTGGICVADKANAGVQYDTELVAGIYIVRLACAGQEYQYKIVLH